jgi:hypothetical protein
MAEGTGESFKPSREQIIEGGLGKRYLEGATDISRGLFSEIKNALAEISRGEGSSNQKSEDAREYGHNALRADFSIRDRLVGRLRHTCLV